VTAPPHFHVIVIGGGHAGVEAAWAAANLLPGVGTVALVTLDPSKIGVMSCNPAIGGLAKGQIVREIDALGGVMGLATDATGIQFKVLNASKGPAVRGPRAQCDKHAYAEAVQRLIAMRPEIRVIAGSVERLVVERGRVVGVDIGHGHMAKSTPGSDAAATSASDLPLCDVPIARLTASAVVLTTGTFMRGLMHCGESKTAGGRFGEASAEGISGALCELGFELGRLKTGTPPRLKRGTIDWDGLDVQAGDDQPTAFSELSGAIGNEHWAMGSEPGPWPTAHCPFPALPQVTCRITGTTAAIHDLIRANLDRAPMYSGQIESAGPRYCPSIEDKVVRFSDKSEHQVFLEPESLRDDWVYCNGISTSLPRDVQDGIVRGMRGCERAEIYRYGYAVEYDMVRPHQIHAGGMTKLVDGLFLAGQINGTSGYEEAAGQGLVAGINAARWSRGQDPVTLGRDEAYIGVMMDDLVTKTPVEPYRMFTSRAEHRLLLRADNATERLAGRALEWGLLDSTDLGRARKALIALRREQLEEIDRRCRTTKIDGVKVEDLIRRPEFGVAELERLLGPVDERGRSWARGVVASAHCERFYAAYVERERAEIKRQRDLERRRLPADVDYRALPALRTEARDALSRFRPETFGQAGRLEGITPADLTLLAVLVKR
jgi:tRNA uridine 5-carboxymethylaminomethyl modification enzyme